MWGRIAKILGLSLLWSVVLLTVGYAVHLRHDHYSELKLSSVDITICDSTSHGQLVTTKMVEEWLQKSKLIDKKQPISALNLHAIERYIAGNGFVGEVSAAVDFDGVLHIVVGQRDPLFRLLVDGYNHYVTSDGYIFRAPSSTSLYVPVVSGDYHPPFTADFEGSIEAMVNDSALATAQMIEDLEPERYPYYRRQRDNRDYNKKTNRMFTKQKVFESDSDFEARVIALKELKYERRRHYRYERLCIEKGLEQIALRGKAMEEEQKKLEKNVKDFQNLITFVKRIEKSKLYRSEIVQIVASKAHSGALEISFVPRCADMVVRFGRLEELDAKFDRWERFSDMALSNCGWNCYSEVSLEFENRVVCTPRR